MQQPIGIRVDLLGGFRVSIGDRPVGADAWRRRKPAALVKLLALAPGHRRHREQLMDVLWPDLEAAAAAANLRKALHHARSALEHAAAGAGDLLVSDGEVIALGRGATTDVAAFQAGLAAARRSRDVDEYRRALEVYRDELLPDDRYDDWAETARRELHVELLAGLTELAGLLEARGDLDEAVEVVRALVAAEPSREESHAALIRLYALAGRRPDALRQYELLVRTLADELAAEPSAETQQLVEEVRTRQSDEPELTTELWERVGDLRITSGDSTGAARAYEKALAVGAATDALARLERKCGEAWLMQHRPDRAAAHLAAAGAARADPVEGARLLRARANDAWERGDLATAQEYADRALTAAREHGTSADVASALEALAIVSHFRGEWREGLASELARLAADDGSGVLLSRVMDMHHCIGQYHLYGDGLWDSVEGYARMLLERAEDAGAVRAQAFAWCLLGESLLLQARWDESDGCLERSCDLHASLGSRTGALPWQRRAELAACTGRHHEVADLLRRASGIATVSPMALHLWGRIHAAAALAAVVEGEPERAVQSVHAAAAAVARYGDCPTCSALLNPIAAEAFALVGDAAGARSYAASAAAVAGMFASAAWRGMAESAAGSEAVAEGEVAAAMRHFDAAARSYDDSGQPYWADRCRRLAAIVPA